MFFAHLNSIRSSGWVKYSNACVYDAKHLSAEILVFGIGPSKPRARHWIMFHSDRIQEVCPIRFMVGLVIF